MDGHPLMEPKELTIGPVHNINKGTNHTTIQAAINAARPGDEIHVDSGTYYENVVVNKQVTLRGIDTGAGMPVVDAGGITLNTDGIILDGFDVRNSGNGIYVTSNYNTLTNNNVSNNNYGIYLYTSSNNTLTDNTVSNNNYGGILLYPSSNNNTLTNNTASNNNYGIYLYSSSNNTLTDNTVSNNNAYGIYLYYSSNSNLTGNIFVNEGLIVLFSYQNTVENNMVNGKPLVYLEDSSDYVITDAGQVVVVNCTNITVDKLVLSNSSVGIELWQTNNSKISDNVINDNYYGIYLYSSSNNSITNNNVNNNNYGIYLYSSSNNNTLTSNNVSNSNYGIYLYSSSKNTIYQNNLNNTNYNAYDYNGNNQWDWGTIGNYYSDYTGTDSNGDGIGDTPYPILGGSSVDSYPLMEPWTNIGPVHNIDKGTNYTTIQAAINAASPGDEIHVDSREYHENVNVNKQLILRGIDTGDGKPVVNASYEWGTAITLSAGWTTLEGFNVRNSSSGISVASNNNLLRNNTATNNNYNGISLVYSSGNNTLIDNIANSNAGSGISLSSSSNNTLRNNSMSGNRYNFDMNIYWTYQPNNISTDNRVDGKYIYYLNDVADIVIDDKSNAGIVYCIECDNVTIKNSSFTNNGVGVYFYKANNSKIENVITSNNSNSGIYLQHSHNTILQDSSVTNNGNYGIYVSQSNNTTLTKNTVRFNGYGISLSYSNNSYLQENIVLGNHGYGMEAYGINLYNSNNNTLRGNIAANNIGDSCYPSCGIQLSLSNHNTLIDNNASDNGGGTGISIGWDSNYNILINNIANNNTNTGITLSGSSNGTLQGNLMSGNHYNFELRGWSDSDVNNNIDTSNLVDGKPIYYLVGAYGVVIDSLSDAGTVYCINCDDVTVKDLTLVNNSNGICFYNTSNSKIEDNCLKNNGYGIHLGSFSNNNSIAGNNVSNNGEGIILTGSSNNNTITCNNARDNNLYGITIQSSGNSTLNNNIVNNNSYGISFGSSDNNTVVGNIASNNYYGILLSYSRNSTLYHNNLVNNTNHNAYDYSGTNQWDSGSEGNYYEDDYTGTDSDGNGIGDTPHPIPGGSSVDNYPLMTPWDTTPPAGPSPELISWGNNKTNDVSSNLKINVFETVQFNATANQTIQTWNWFMNDINQNNDIHNLSIQFESTGTYTIKVNATNLNGTSNTITWNIEVNEPSISISNSDILTWKGQNKTFEIILKNTCITDINISETKTNKSWIHSVSTMPALGPNDEKSIYFSMYVPNDISAGNYKIPLNISLDIGYVFAEQLNITIFNEPTSYVQVKIVDSESGEPIPDAMVMVDGNDTIHYVDSNGFTNIKTMPEAKSIYAFAVGYMPNYEVSYLKLGQNNIEIRLSKGEVIISDFDIKRLNSTEIIEAGIDLTDTDNYWVYNFSVNLTVETVDLTEYDEWFNKTVIVPQCTLPTIEYETKAGFKVIAFPLELSGNLSGNVTNAKTTDSIPKAKVTM